VIRHPPKGHFFLVADVPKPCSPATRYLLERE
jgi:hypothetical protein